MTTRAALRLTLVLLAALAATVAVAVPAHAGGPTSVLLVNAATGDTAALYHKDADYDALAQAVGLAGGDSTAQPTEPPQEQSFGSEVRLTWLIHDMSIWRIDRIHLSADGGWLVQTTVNLADGSLDDVTPVWHRPADPARLAALLRTAGVIGADGAKSATTFAPTEAAEAPWWPIGLAGFAGLVVGLGGGLFMARHRRPPAPPAADREPTERVVLTG